MVTLIQASEKPIELIAKIASICYDSEPKNPLALVKHLYNNGHHSVFEHIHFTFKIENISRACSHQLVRHRHCSFTQRSQRYCDEGNEVSVIVPESISEKDNLDLYKYATEQEARYYNTLTQTGIPREDAR